MVTGRFCSYDAGPRLHKDLWFGEFGLGDLGGLANNLVRNARLDHSVGGFAKDCEMAIRPARKFCCTGAASLGIEVFYPCFSGYF